MSIFKRTKEYLFGIILMSVLSGVLSLILMSVLNGIINILFPIEVIPYIGYTIIWIVFLIISGIYFYNQGYRDKKRAGYDIKSFGISAVIASFIYLLPNIKFIGAGNIAKNMLIILWGYEYPFAIFTNDLFFSGILVTAINIAVYLQLYKLADREEKKDVY